MSDTTTRERMISTAVRLFRRDGFAATSWRRLVDEAGTPWGSAHHHFPGGKEQLGVEAIRLGGRIVGKTIDHAFRTHDSAPEAIRWWFAKAAEALADTDYRGGCPLATITLETANSSPLLTAALRETFEQWHQQLRSAFRERGHPEQTADELATATTTNLEGALLLARVRRSPDPLTVASEHVAILIAERSR